MGAESHAIHYDLLVYGGSGKSRVRPFVSFGGGVKYYRGTGPERAFQPLSNLVLLTQTSEWKGMITVGGGVKYAVSKHVSSSCRVQRLHLTSANQVINPGRGTHNSVAGLTISCRCSE